MRKMLRAALSLTVVAVSYLLIASCSQESSEAEFGEAPELLRAVPADAVAVGIFDRCEDALEHMLDSEDMLRKLDLGKLRKHKAVVALCNLGSISPLLIVETGKAEHGEGLRAATDTTHQTAEVAALADSLRLFSAQLALNNHNVLLLSQSATLITVARRHLSSETSILDAPYFDGTLPLISGHDAIAMRNSGASKLISKEFCSLSRKQVNGFLKNAAEWTVLCGDRLQTVQPQAEKYFCNFLTEAGEGQSKLASVIPADAELIIDLPIAELEHWREAYQTMTDARVELEAYNKRIQALKKRSGKSPLDWEKELDIKEVAYIAAKDYRLNLVRTAKSGKKEGVQTNPYSGFVRALYGEPFFEADSCAIRQGNWIISGPRAVLDTLQTKNLKGWPSTATAVVQVPGMRLTWTKEKSILWQDSNR